MKAEYVPTAAPEQLVHVAEECAEVIEQCAKLTLSCSAVQKSIAKILRFGLDNGNPTVPEDERVTNAEQLRGELWDLEIAIGKARELLDAPEKCPACGGELAYGYGLAGGGIGSYVMCLNDDCDHFDKKPDGSDVESEDPAS